MSNIMNNTGIATSISYTSNSAVLSEFEILAYGVNKLLEPIRQRFIDLGHHMLRNDSTGFRVTCFPDEFFPYATHSHFGYDLNFCKEKLGKIGELSSALRHRIICRPKNALFIASTNYTLRHNSLREIYHSARILELMEKNFDSVIVISIGNEKEEPDEIVLNRWKVEFEKLPENIQARLVVENNLFFDVEILYEFLKPLNVPVVVNLLANSVVYSKIAKDNLANMVADVWKDKNIRKLVIYGESKANAPMKEAIAPAKCCRKVSINEIHCDGNVDIYYDAESIFE